MEAVRSQLSQCVGSTRDYDVVHLVEQVAA